MNANPESAPTERTPGAGQSAEKVVALLHLIGGLDATIAFERSFKATAGQLFEDRFLLGVGRSDRAGALDAPIIDACSRIGMPSNMLSVFARNLADANHVYFGAENDESGLIFKAYLEFRDRTEKELGGSPACGQSYPLFTGFKWQVAQPSQQAVTEYGWHPSLPPAQILERLATIIDPHAHPVLHGIVSRVTEQVGQTLAHDAIQYVEVTEAGNSRRSFDINLYKSGHRLEDIHPHLLEAMQHYEVAPARFESLYQRISAERFGHLAGGIDRHGRDFMTIYYGVRQVQAGQLRSAATVPGHR